MANLPEPSIRHQLLIMSVGLLLVIAFVSYWAANLYGQRAARLSYDRLLTGAALQIAESIHSQDGEVVINLPRSAFELLSLAPEDRLFYAINDQHEGFLTGYSGLPKLPRADRGKSQGLDARDHLSPRFFERNYSGEAVRFLTLTKPLIESGGVREVEITLGQTQRARQQLAQDISFKALQFVLLFFLIALALTLSGIWLILRPLRSLNKDLEGRSPQDLSPLDVAVPAEVNPLLCTINHFMLQLGNTLDGLKRFTGEAAHQLRTPLAGLKSQAQNALDEPDEKRRKEQLKRVVESSDLLSDTVSQLLNQATLAYRFQSQAMSPVHLDQLVKEVGREVAVTALDRGVEVAYLGQDGIQIKGDDFALKQMIRNILENAIKYSSSGDSVEVNLDRVGAGVLLAISDLGPGIDDEEKPHVFERFYRSQNNPRPGSGLGLSIAREVALHHRAGLSLKDNHPHGLRVEILFSANSRAAS